MRLARPAQQAVGIVLDDDDVVLLGQLEHAPAPLERHRRAARVLEVRDHVEERGRLALELGGERVRVDAVTVDRHADDLGARALQDQDAAVVGRRLDEHALGRGAGEQHVARRTRTPRASRSRRRRARPARRSARRSSVRRPWWPPGEYESATAGSRSIAVASARRMSSTGSMSALGTPRVNGIASAMPPAYEDRPCVSRRRPGGARRTPPRPARRRRGWRRARPPSGRSRACARAAG